MGVDAAACDGATLVPYTLLGFLLWGNRATSYSPVPTNCSVVFDGIAFMRDYAERGTNALLWIALVSVMALLLRRISTLLRLWRLGSRIPGPPFASFVGHSRMAICGDDSTDYLSNLHEKYGKIVKMWLGPTQLLVSVSDPRTIQEVLTKAKDKLPLTGRIFRFAFGRTSLFVSSFEKVKNRRELLAFYLNQKFLAVAVPSKVVEYTLKRVDSTPSAGSFDCWSVSQHLAFYVLGVTIFGDAFLTWPSTPIYEELLVKIAKDASLWDSYNIAPVWKRDFWKYQFLSWRFKYLTNDIIRHCNQSRNLNNHFNHAAGIGKDATDGAHLQNDISIDGFFIREIYQHLISNEEPSGNVMGLMFHGFLRIASLIANVLTRLVLHPELQDQIYLDILGQQKELSESKHVIEKMQLLLVTIYEAARLLPARPLLQRCSFKSDIDLEGGIKVPAGAVLVVPVRLVQMDTSVWGSDAFNFNPHRFFLKVTNGKLSSEGKPSSVPLSNANMTGDEEGSERCMFHPSEMNGNMAFFPFGFGARACIGQNLAVHGISNLFAHLLQHYKIVPLPGTENDPKPVLKDCVLQLIPSLKITLVQRNL